MDLTVNDSGEKRARLRSRPLALFLRGQVSKAKQKKLEDITWPDELPCKQPSPAQFSNYYTPSGVKGAKSVWAHIDAMFAGYPDAADYFARQLYAVFVREMHEDDKNAMHPPVLTDIPTTAKSRRDRGGYPHGDYPAEVVCEWWDEVMEHCGY